MSAPPIPPGRWLARHRAGTIDAPAHLWGFGALHGGLAVAVLTRAIQQASDGHGLVRSLTGRLHRPITGPFTATTSQPRRGRATADAIDPTTGTTLASASLITSPARSASFPVLAPECPAAPPVDECEPFVVPPEFVPISVFMQIRPVGPNRPYAGGDRAELTAWVRLTEDDRAPDLHRMIVLLDALAPSYAAILTELQPVPTVEFTVRPAHRLDQASSPWVLLHAATVSATGDGWLHERIDAFDATGIHLASADQLRTAIASQTRREDSQ
jgi:Thioesterase-like superfamily